MIDDRHAVVPDHSNPDDARGVIETAFDLLDHVAALQPARLIDLSETTGIPRATVHRLLKQLIDVGAVRRDGTRYRLGASLLGLGALVSRLDSSPSRAPGFRRERRRRGSTPKSAA